MIITYKKLEGFDQPLLTVSNMKDKLYEPVRLAPWLAEYRFRELDAVCEQCDQLFNGEGLVLYDDGGYDMGGLGKPLSNIYCEEHAPLHICFCKHCSQKAMSMVARCIKQQAGIGGMAALQSYQRARIWSVLRRSLDLRRALGADSVSFETIEESI